MNQFYNVAVNALLAGTLDLDSDALSVTALSNQNFDAANAVLGHLSGIIPGVAAQPLTGRSIAGRALYAADITFPAVGEAYAVRALALHRTGVSPMLVAYIDRRPDLAPLFVQGNGGPVTVQWGGGNGMVIRL